MLSDTERIILDISYRNKLSHLRSCLTALPIIEEIFDKKNPGDKFVLSAGHAALALFAVNERRNGKLAQEAWDHHGTHPDRCDECLLDCSTGSLGHGLGISLGIALSERSKKVYCLISDGECMEGSIWEAIRVAKEQRLNNLIVYVNLNGTGGYKEIDS